MVKVHTIHQVFALGLDQFVWLLNLVTLLKSLSSVGTELVSSMADSRRTTYINSVS